MSLVTESHLAFEVLMIDPPWQMRKVGLRNVRPLQGRPFPYSTMPVTAIFNLLDDAVFTMAADRNVVFIWAVDRYLADCETQMQRRGYRRHARLIWNKTTGVAAAFTVWFCHEYLLWYYKPTLLPIAQNVRGRYGTVLTERSRQHSRKPEAAYEMVDALYPGLSKIDVFSREQRPGWSQFGDQPDYFNSNLL